MASKGKVPRDPFSFKPSTKEPPPKKLMRMKKGGNDHDHHDKDNDEFLEESIDDLLWKPATSMVPNKQPALSSHKPAPLSSSPCTTSSPIPSTHLKRNSSSDDKDDFLDDPPDFITTKQPAPLPSSSSSSTTPPSKKSTHLRRTLSSDDKDDFLNNSPDIKSKPASSTTKPASYSTTNKQPASTSSSPNNKKPTTTQLRRSLSSDNDDFLSMDLFSTKYTNDNNNKDNINNKDTKSKVERELEHALPHLTGILKGSIPSELAEKYKKGGKDRKGMKWSLNTGGFSEDEFDLIIELLQQHFPQCDLHYITDVLWQEAAVQILMERNKFKNQQTAVRILKAVEFSKVDKQELRRYQSDSSLLTAVAKYQEMIDSPLSTPESSQEKRKSKSPSSSQEKPSSQDSQRKPRSLSTSSTSFTKPSINKAQAPTSSYIPDAPEVDLTKVRFTKQHIASNNGSFVVGAESTTTVLTTTTTIATTDDDDFMPSNSTSSTSPLKSNPKLTASSPSTSSPKKADNEGGKASDWITRKVKTQT